jgi:hypothetical protein
MIRKTDDGKSLIRASRSSRNVYRRDEERELVERLCGEHQR